MNTVDEDIGTNAQRLPGPAMHNRSIIAYAEAYGRMQIPCHSGFEEAVNQFKF
jgi:hypothetical protein